MKKTILFGAVVVAVTVAFLYVPHAILAPEKISVPVSVPTATTTPIANTNATLKVGEISYPISVHSGETVLDAMHSLATSGFIFTGRDYPGMGFFVDSINGQKNAGGKYWMFYVNGVSATSGVSTYIISKGDVVEWKYEKGY